MKIKSVLSGVAAILLVSAFYIFTLGIVDEVDDTQISDEYLYSTVTSEITSEENVTEQTINEYTEESQSTDISSAGTNKQLPAQTAVPQAGDDSEPEPVVPTYNTDEEPVDEDLVYTYDDQELYDDDDSDGLGTVKADSQSVYARDTNDYQVFAKQNYTVTTAPAKTKGRKSTTTQATTQATTQSTTARETTVTYPTTTTATTAATTANVGSETLSVRVNGTTQSMDAYTLVCMIVQNEMSSSFTDEALKAQAVAAYSYVKYNNSTGISPSVLVNTNVSDRVKSMVSSVWGFACYYNGSIAQTVYCASTAGYSSSSVNVWGGNVPYLVSVACPFDSIHVVDGVACVNPLTCKACGKCVEACPKHLIELIPYDTKHVVKCSSKDKGKDVMKACSVGCIGCHLCEKNCPSSSCFLVKSHRWLSSVSHQTPSI